MCWLTRLFTSGMNKPSPSDIVPEGSIHIVENPKGVLINLAKLNIPFNNPPKVWVPEIPDTNSMDPSFDFGHNNILIAGTDEADHKRLVDFLKVGDITVYRIMSDPADSPNDYSKKDKFYAIHRIVDISTDSEGRYFRFQGDNSGLKDPYKVRDSEILWLCVGTIF